MKHARQFWRPHDVIGGIRTGGIFRRAVVLTLVAIFVLAPGAATQAHRAPSGWEYPDECCRDDRDCQMIPADSIELDEKGYIVDLEPGEHRHAPAGGRFFLLHDQVRRSGDDDYHLCLHVYTNGPGALCIYVPPEVLSRNVQERPKG